MSKLKTLKDIQCSEHRDTEHGNHWKIPRHILKQEAMKSGAQTSHPIKKTQTMQQKAAII